MKQWVNKGRYSLFDKICRNTSMGLEGRARGMDGFRVRLWWMVVRGESWRDGWFQGEIMVDGWVVRYITVEEG